MCKIGGPLCNLSTCNIQIQQMAVVLQTALLSCHHSKSNVRNLVMRVTPAHSLCKQLLCNKVKYSAPRTTKKGVQEVSESGDKSCVQTSGNNKPVTTHHIG